MKLAAKLLEPDKLSDAAPTKVVSLKEQVLRADLDKVE